MKKHFLLCSLGALFAFSSCEKASELNVFSSVRTDFSTVSETRFSANIDYVGEDLVLESFSSGPTQKSTSVVSDGSDEFVLVANLSSPTVNDVLLSASYVELLELESSTKLFATYNLRGEEHGGALVVIDFTDPTNPILEEEILFSSTDINVCEINVAADRLFLGGSSKYHGASLITLSIDNNGDLIKENDEIITETLCLDGVASINGLVEGMGWLYLSAGNSGGGAYMLDYNASGTDGSGYKFLSYPNAKFLASNGQVDGSLMACFQGGKDAKIHLAGMGNWTGVYPHSVSVGSVEHAGVADEYALAGKATCFLDPGTDICYVSLGVNGFAAYNVKESKRLFVSSDAMLDNGNTNAITADDDFIYFANGADGVVFCDKPAINIDTEDLIITPKYVWDEGDQSFASANYVTALGGYVFVAKGANGGLKIIKHKM